ncbi:MAG: hypothetical protein ABI601_04735 [bacterium]
MARRAARCVAIAASLTLPAATARSQAHSHPSERHDRTATVGTVHFATTCAPAVAPMMDRAVALLHSFEFGSSIRAFSDVLASDSTCAMAQWGIALSRWTNPMAAGNRPVALLQQGRLAADAATRLGSNASERERGYIGAVSRLYDDFEHVDQRARVASYETAMRELTAREPSDTEAMIFHALSLVAAASPTDKSYSNQLEAGRILEALWAKQPQHPGLAHYIIHSYDYPELAPRARAAARRYAVIAPSAAHALHMPSHTFTRLGMWRESVAANARSTDVALRDGAIAEVLHAADYAVYASLQIGREADAKVWLDRLPALAARFDPKSIRGAAPASAAYFALAAIPARWVLERDAWREAAALVPRATDYPYTEAMTYFARAIGAARTGDVVSASTAVDSLASIERGLKDIGESYWSEQVVIQRLTAQAWLALARAQPTDALVLMREAATREDATEKNAVTPGPLAPAHELLGDMLTSLGRREEAVAEYRATLRKEPNRRHALMRLRAQRRSK